MQNCVRKINIAGQSDPCGVKTDHASEVMTEWPIAQEMRRFEVHGAADQMSYVMAVEPATKQEHQVLHK